MTRQQAINAFCKGCIYDPDSGLGTWRQQVELCASNICPLHPYRPRSRGRVGADRQQKAPPCSENSYTADHPEGGHGS
jgi:hypothetical protein